MALTAAGRQEEFVPLRERVGQALTAVGVPEPQGPVEQIVGEASRAVAGAGGGVAAGRMLSQAPGAVGQAGRFLAEEPGLQLAGAAGATGAAQATREMGGTPVEEFAAGVLGGVAPALMRGAPTAPQTVTRELQTETGATLRVPMPRQAPPPPQREITAAELGQLVRTAATGGLGSQRAVEELAKLAKVDPEALAAAQRLGIDLPPDVWADHTQLREAVGLTRSVAGSVASATWRDQVREAARAADDALTQIDSSPDLSAVSSRIRTALTDQRDTLQRQAKQLYDTIDARVPQNTIVEPDNTVRVLNTVIANLRGQRGLTAQEQRLLNMVTNQRQPVSYFALMREKQAIGRALERFEGPYADVDQATLRRLYGALAEDQLATVERVGGAQLRADLRLANQTTAMQKALERRITKVFGSDQEGSIASQLRAALSSGGRGDTSGLNRALRAIPQDLRRQAIGSTIAALSRGGPEGAFGFAQYATLYQGIRRNSETYRLVAQAMGPEGESFLRDLYEVSRRVTDARAQVLTTGKANQALVQALTGEGLVARALNSTVGRRAAQGAASVVAGTAGGPIAGAATAMALDQMVSASRKDALQSAGDLFSSPEFQELVITMSTKTRVDEKAVRRVEASQAFRAWAKEAGIADPSRWLRGAIASSYAQSGYREPRPVTPAQMRQK
jgi:hypothetical protein